MILVTTNLLINKSKKLKVNYIIQVFVETMAYYEFFTKI